MNESTDEVGVRGSHELTRGARCSTWGLVGHVKYAVKLEVENISSQLNTRTMRKVFKSNDQISPSDRLQSNDDA